MKQPKGAMLVVTAIVLRVSLFPFPLTAGSSNFRMASVTLTQPDDVLKTRISGASGLADYIRRIVAEAEIAFDKSRVQRSMTGAIVVAVKPNNKSKCWLMVSDGQVPSDVSRNFHNRFDSIKPMAVQGGPVAFAIHFTTNGGGKPFAGQDSPMPYPDQWKEAAKKLSGPVLVPDGILALIWPN